MSEEAVAHVLIVEDDPVLRRVLQMQLNTLGYRVSLGSDGVEGFEQAKADPPDVILLDLMMPRMNGFQLLKRLKALDALVDIPVIILTASHDDHHRRKSESHLADGYLTKPYTEAALHETLQRVLGAPQGRD